MLSFEQARSVVCTEVLALRPHRPVERVGLLEAQGRFLAELVRADRDCPPFDRSIRDGFAVRSADVAVVPAALAVRGEVRAGTFFAGRLGPGECVAIMTGAPLPPGADAVVMVEHTHAAGSTVRVLRAVRPRENVAGRGSEARAESPILSPGRRLGPAELGLLASVGQAHVNVVRPPAVAILATGDEVVPIDQAPQWFQIRNSNAVTLQAQVAAAGGVPRLLAIAPDSKEPLRRLIEQGLGCDLLLVTGGVSVGRYDLVEEVLHELGAEVYFSSVAIRPGKPLTFGRVAEKFFFGLPGNPVSTFVTFQLFARPALQALAGGTFEPPVFLRARLSETIRNPAGLTTFMPARVTRQGGDPRVSRVAWQGSGDLVGMTAANCFLVVHPEQTEVAEGEWVDVMPMGD